MDRRSAVPRGGERAGERLPPPKEALGSGQQTVCVPRGRGGAKAFFQEGRGEERERKKQTPTGTGEDEREAGGRNKGEERGEKNNSFTDPPPSTRRGEEEGKDRREERAGNK